MENKMSRVQKIYRLCDEKETTIEALITANDELFIEFNSGSYEYVVLDKESAIEFVEALNNLIKEM
jgi:hypothetical protein